MASTYFVPKPDPNLEPRRLDRVLARMMPPLLGGPSEHREGQNGGGQGNPSAGTCAGGGRWAEVRLPGQEGEHASGRGEQVPRHAPKGPTRSEKVSEQRSLKRRVNLERGAAGVPRWGAVTERQARPSDIRDHRACHDHLGFPGRSQW